MKIYVIVLLAVFACDVHGTGLKLLQKSLSLSAGLSHGLGHGVHVQKHFEVGRQAPVRYQRILNKEAEVQQTSSTGEQEKYTSGGAQFGGHQRVVGQAYGDDHGGETKGVQEKVQYAVRQQQGDVSESAQAQYSGHAEVERHQQGGVTKGVQEQVQYGVSQQQGGVSGGAQAQYGEHQETISQQQEGLSGGDHTQAQYSAHQQQGVSSGIQAQYGEHQEIIGQQQGGLSEAVSAQFGEHQQQAGYSTGIQAQFRGHQELLGQQQGGFLSGQFGRQQEGQFGQGFEFSGIPQTPIDLGTSAGLQAQAVRKQVITITKEQPVHIPQPYPVTVTKEVKVPVPQPYPVHIPKPYPVPVQVKVPVHIPKPYPVKITQQVPVKVPVYVKVPHPIKVSVPVSKPYPVKVVKEVQVKIPTPVYVKVPVPINTQVKTVTDYSQLQIGSQQFYQSESQFGDLQGGDFNAQQQFGGVQGAEFQSQESSGLGGIQNAKFGSQSQYGGVQGGDFNAQQQFGHIQNGEFQIQGSSEAIQSVQLQTQNQFGDTPEQYGAAEASKLQSQENLPSGGIQGVQFQSQNQFGDVQASDFHTQKQYGDSQGIEFHRQGNSKLGGIQFQSQFGGGEFYGQGNSNLDEQFQAQNQVQNTQSHIVAAQNAQVHRNQESSTYGKVQESKFQAGFGEGYDNADETTQEINFQKGQTIGGDNFQAGVSFQRTFSEYGQSEPINGYVPSKVGGMYANQGYNTYASHWKW